jgi:hypothetical protein
MPFDAAPFALAGAPELANIPKSKPLTIRRIQRIVRCAQAHGLLAMDHAAEIRSDPRMYSEVSTSRYVSPHRAVDTFLGSPDNRRSSCPCNLRGSATRFYLQDLNKICIGRSSATL